jgi:hypothetical protein
MSARIVTLRADHGSFAVLALDFGDDRGRWVSSDYVPKASEPLEAPWDPTLFFVRSSTFDRALAENGLQPVWRGR